MIIVELLYSNYIFLSQFGANENTVLLGDFNIDLLNFQDTVVTNYKNMLNSVGFSPLINKPTRVFRAEGCSQVSSSCLDHILTNDILRMQRAERD